VDKCSLTVTAGSGGNGCISFVREKYIANGPANGGDGGTGGNILIQAVRGETSLHKLARKTVIKAARGQNGRGKSQGGQRAEDVLIQVPVGTVVREIARLDPGLAMSAKEKTFGADAVYDEPGGDEQTSTDQIPKWRRDKWVLYPGGLPRSFTNADFPALPRLRRSNLAARQLKSPIRLDLDNAMSAPVLLVSGAVGGLGNPHFVTKSITRPKFATKGEQGISIDLEFELKILADVGLVGFPNAGKSTLLRALTNSRTRVGDWAFTTLQPSVGTVMLSSDSAVYMSHKKDDSTRRESFTIADIPGLIEDAHLDKGLGLGFLRHVERAAVLAFVVDLSNNDPVQTLKTLWREVGEYESIRDREIHAETERHVSSTPSPPPRKFKRSKTKRSPDNNIEADNATANPFSEPLDYKDPGMDSEPGQDQSVTSSESVGHSTISSKPWLVIATKADKSNTEDSFVALQQYIKRIETGEEAHPSGKVNAWRKGIEVLPVCALKKEGTEKITPVVLDLLIS